MSSSYLQVAEQYRQEQRHRMFFMASTFTVLCCAIGAAGSGSGRATMMLLSIGSIGVCSLILLAMMHLARELLLPRLIVASYALQCFWLTFVAVFDVAGIDSTASLPDMYQNPYRAVLPNLLVPLAALAAIGFWRLLPVRALSRGDLWRLTEEAPPGFGFYLVASALLLLAYWPATEEHAGWWAYGVRAIHVGFMPLFMGRYFRQFPWANRLWMSVLAINAVIGLSLGGRSLAFIPVVLYLIGRTLAQPAGKRLRSLVLVGLLGLPLFAISGALGAVRGEIGRGDFSIFSLDRIAETTNAIRSRLAYRSNVTDQAILLNGPGRMVVWPNLDAAILTPETIPYRGFDDFAHEVLLSFKIFALANFSRQDTYDAGLFSYPATRYGYSVNTGTSVEWGVLADGWSRGGPWATMLFGFVLTVFFIIAEYILLTRSIQTSQALLMISGFLIVTALMNPATTTLLYILRQVVLDCGLILMLTFIVERCRPRAEVALARKRSFFAGGPGLSRDAGRTSR
ncbi:MAG: hypothetical protein ACLP3R_00405 [Candidatus Korobacteraceae bacterium]